MLILNCLNGIILKEMNIIERLFLKFIIKKIILNLKIKEEGMIKHE